MKSFSFSDMNRLSGEILEAALTEPVTLTKYGKERLVIIPADRYRAIIGTTPVTAYTLESAPDAIHSELMKGLDAILSTEKPHA